MHYLSADRAVLLREIPVFCVPDAAAEKGGTAPRGTTFTDGPDIMNKEVPKTWLQTQE